jgi:hypothetical protein
VSYGAKVGAVPLKVVDLAYEVHIQFKCWHDTRLSVQSHATCGNVNNWTVKKSTPSPSLHEDVSVNISLAPAMHG